MASQAETCLSPEVEKINLISNFNNNNVMLII